MDAGSSQCTDYGPRRRLRDRKRLIKRIKRCAPAFVRFINRFRQNTGLVMPAFCTIRDAESFFAQRETYRT